MSSMGTAAKAEQMAIEAVVLRCGCGHPEQHRDQPCPQGTLVRLGTVSYWHKNPLMRLKYYLMRRFNPSLSFWARPKPDADAVAGNGDV